MKPLAAATAARNSSGLTLVPSTAGGRGGSVQTGCASAGAPIPSKTAMNNKMRTIPPTRQVSHRAEHFRQTDAVPPWYAIAPQKCQEAVRKMSRGRDYRTPVRQPAVGITQ